ncbi:MAG: hypothetical protein RLW61_02140 [Gammaproteobacteria bacterium]
MSTWRAPIGIALASVVGLVGALLGDGAVDALAAAALAVPIGAVLWAMRARRG